MIGPAARTVSFATALVIATASTSPGQAVGWAWMAASAWAQAPVAPAPTSAPAGAPTGPAATSPTAPPPPVSAQDEALGRQHFEKGQELYNKSRYLEAAREFEAGYRALPRSAFLLNIGHSYRRAYELRKARSAYETMLRVDPTSPHRALVEDLIRTIDDALVAQEAPPPPPPRPGLPPAAATAAPPVPAAPPRADNAALAPPPAALSDDAAPGEESGSVFTSPWFWGVVGAVVVTAGVGGVLLLRRSQGCPAQTCVMAN